MTKPQGRKAGRSAKDGRFVPIEKARQYPNTHVVEVVPLPKKEKK